MLECRSGAASAGFSVGLVDERRRREASATGMLFSKYGVDRLLRRARVERQSLSRPLRSRAKSAKLVVARRDFTSRGVTSHLRNTVDRDRGSGGSDFTLTMTGVFLLQIVHARLRLR